MGHAVLARENANYRRVVAQPCPRSTAGTPEQLAS
jgi:hypothetical protein